MIEGIRKALSKFMAKPHKLKSFGILLLGVGIFTAIYMPVNWVNSLRQSHYHLYMDWELQIPLVPWFILVYYSAYLLALFSFFSLDLKEHKELVKTVALGGAIGGVIFLVVPTELGYARDMDKVTYLAPMFEFLWKLDLPHNLMPSQHVVMSHLLIVPAARNLESNWARGFWYFWLAMICASIVLVHQHHLIDIVTGLILAQLCYKYYYLKRLEDLGIGQKGQDQDDDYPMAS